METPDHSKKIFYLLAAGALLVMLAGGLTGIAKRSSAVPQEAMLLNLNELSVDFPINELRLALGSKEPWQDVLSVITRVQGFPTFPSAAAPSSPNRSIALQPAQ